MGDHVLAKNSGIREIAEQQKILKRDIECIKHHIQYQMTASRRLETVSYDCDEETIEIIEDKLRKIFTTLQSSKLPLKAVDVARQSGVGSAKSDVNRYLYALEKKGHLLNKDNKWSLQRNMIDSDLPVYAAEMARVKPSKKHKAKTDLSSIQTGSNIQIGGSGSLNVFGGTVRTKDNEHVQIGQPLVPNNMNSNNCRGEGIDLPDGSASSAGANSFSDDSNFKKMIDNALPQAIMNKYNEIMKSVGALTVSNQVVGTVFRVGSKYVITAWHCVKFIVDPMNNGAMDWHNLQDPGVLVTFVYADVTKNPVNFSILNSIVTDELRNLDIAILELSDSSKLPQCLKLYTDEISYTRVPQVDIVGYGHPNSPNKHFDPSCNIVLPTDKVLQAAQAWLQQNKQRLIQTLKSNVDPDLVDWGYTGYDRTDKIIFNFFLEHGSSGAPIFTTKCLGDPVVIGVVTNGLPNCFWDLTTTGQMLFPVQYRLEMGTRMSHIHSALRSSNPDLASELIL